MKEVEIERIFQKELSRKKERERTPLRPNVETRIT